MKAKSIYKKGLVFLLTGLALAACTKRQTLTIPTTGDFGTTSMVQVYQATVNATRNYVYVDAFPITGATLASGSVFPSGNGTIAANIQPGVRAFLVRDTLAAATQVPLSFVTDLTPGSNYTIFLYDTINSPKQKTVQTNIVIPADTTARIRFANFVFSATQVPAVDIYSKRRNVNLFTNIPTTEVTNFIPVPSAFNDTFYVRETGTTNLLATLNGLNPTRKRSYTLVFRGRYQSTTGGVVRTLSSFVNY